VAFVIYGEINYFTKKDQAEIIRDQAEIISPVRLPAPVSIFTSFYSSVQFDTSVAKTSFFEFSLRKHILHRNTHICKYSFPYGS